MARIDISAQIRGNEELSRFLESLSGKDTNSVVTKAIRAGVRDAAGKGRTILAKSIGQRYSLSAARIKQDISQAQFRDGGLSAVIRTSRKPITAMQFKPLPRPRGKLRGLSLRIYRGGKRTVVQSGFVAKGLPFKRRGKERMPLDVIHGPSIHAIYSGGKHSPELQRLTEDRIQEALARGILKRLGAMGRGYGR